MRKLHDGSKSGSNKSRIAPVQGDTQSPASDTSNNNDNTIGRNLRNPNQRRRMCEVTLNSPQKVATNQQQQFLSPSATITSNSPSQLLSAGRTGQGPALSIPLPTFVPQTHIPTSSLFHPLQHFL